MIKHKKYSKKEQLDMVELQLLATRTKFISSLHPIINKLFSKYIMDIYDKGGKDMLDDWKVISKRFKKLGIKV